MPSPAPLSRRGSRRLRQLCAVLDTHFRARRVAAARHLRVRHVLAYVLDRVKVDDKTPANYELLCNDKPLPLTMNVGTVRNCLWKNGPEVQLTYRRRKPTATARK